MPDNFDGFTEEARNVLRFAHEESQRLNHDYIGSEHLLLGLLREKDTDAGLLLRIMEIHLGKARSAVEFIVGRGDPSTDANASLTPHAMNVIELAVDEARSMNHHRIGAEHLLLGVVREAGIGAGVIEALSGDTDLDKMRTLVSRIHATGRNSESDSK